MTLRVLLFLVLGVAVSAPGRAQGPVAPLPLILISLDGFRRDYIDLYSVECPTLRKLTSEGVSARGLIPTFPSNTFPNHYSLVTGLYPAKHGIINNTFSDPGLGAVFQYSLRQSVSNSRWWGGEPIWVTAIKQGRKAATAFWVGSEAEIAGVRPTFWRPFDSSFPFEKRLEELIGWLKLPADQRPAVIAFYWDEPNGAGHRYGPDSPEVAAAIKRTDDSLAAMLRQLQREKIDCNLLIVSDHGMTATSKDRIVILDDHLDRASVHVDADGSAVALRPLTGDVESVMHALAHLPHARAYRAEELPARLQLKGNPRIAPVWVLPEEGWHVVLRSTLERLRAGYQVNGYLQGDHGYDPNLPSMHGILIAHGPAFRRGVEIPALENIHVYELMCAVLRLQPAKNDGDDRLVRASLRD